MSHIVEIQTQVRDPVAVAAACTRLGLPQPVEETVQLFSGEVHGLAVRLPGWTYPIVCQTESGTLKYDNYEGRWGDPAELGQLLQMYAVEKAKLEARRRGHSVVETPLQDGSVKLVVSVGGIA